MPVRRLQAEGVRDTVLAVSGQLDRKLFGPSMGGDGGNRRSVYIQLKRRYMPEFLMAFDMPNATETFGRRNITASPTQSLIPAIPLSPCNGLLRTSVLAV